MKKIRPLYLALLVAKASPGGTIDGRTRIHKLIYLEQLMAKRSDVSFRPYYYGPFSDELASGLSEAVALGLLREHIYSPGDSDDIINYIYDLTESGKTFYEEIVSKADEIKDVEKPLLRIQNLTHGLTVTQVSCMAKALFILKSKDNKREWTVSDIVGEAKRFKWEIKDNMLPSLMRKLVELNLAEAK